MVKSEGKPITGRTLSSCNPDPVEKDLIPQRTKEEIVQVVKNFQKGKIAT